MERAEVSAVGKWKAGRVAPYSLTYSPSDIGVVGQLRRTYT